MNWVDHAVWWHVYPLGFTGAPVRPTGPADRETVPRLRVLEAWLDYALALGTSGLLLGPVFTSSTHGYDTLDHFSLDPRLGTEADFDHLLAECRARGLRVVLDGVFNHVGAEHPYVRRALTEGPQSEYAPWFRIDWDAEGGPRPAVFEGHASLVAFDHDADPVADHVASVMRFWLGRGIDGWRLDAAYAVPPAFWARVLPGVRRDFPDAWFTGEVIHGDYPAIVREAGWDSLTQYELWKATWSALKDANFFELDWALRRHDDFLEVFTPTTFVGNHDVTRIASQVGPDKAVLALVILTTVGGIPCIYSGDEQAFTGMKEDRPCGDDAVRPPFPARPEDLLGMGEWMYRAHQELIGLRRRHPWLVRARTEAVELSTGRYVYDTLDPGGAGRLRVELDVTGTPTARVSEGGQALYAFG